MPTQTRNSVVVLKLGRRVAALKKYDAALGTILINGQAFTPSALVALYEKSIDDRSQAETLRAALHNLVLQQKLDDQAYLAIDKGLQAFVFAKYGASSEAAGDFGYAPPKPRKTAVKVKALAVDKSLATREARHTMGPKQKEGIKGTLPAQAANAPATTPSSTPPTK